MKEKIGRFFDNLFNATNPVVFQPDAVYNVLVSSSYRWFDLI